MPRIKFEKPRRNAVYQLIDYRLTGTSRWDPHLTTVVVVTRSWRDNKGLWLVYDIFDGTEYWVRPMELAIPNRNPKLSHTPGRWLKSVTP